MAIRDEAQDFLNAYRAEYEAYAAAGLTDRAAAVADVLASLGHPVSAPVEFAVETAPLETATDTPVPPRRRGRPRKVELVNG